MKSEPFGYKKLRIWQDARDLTIAIHGMTLRNLPKFEMYEEGSQIRRSMKSVKSNIVEGFGRRVTKPNISGSWISHMHPHSKPSIIWKPSTKPVHLPISRFSPHSTNDSFISPNPFISSPKECSYTTMKTARSGFSSIHNHQSPINYPNRRL